VRVDLIQPLECSRLILHAPGKVRRKAASDDQADAAFRPLGVKRPSSSKRSGWHSSPVCIEPMTTRLGSVTLPTRIGWSSAACGVCMDHTNGHQKYQYVGISSKASQYIAPTIVALQTGVLRAPDQVNQYIYMTESQIGARGSGRRRPALPWLYYEKLRLPPTCDRGSAASADAAARTGRAD
jgi:hypothetical protein